MQSIAKFLYIIFVSFIFRATTLSERNSRLIDFFFFWQLCDGAVPTLLTTAIIMHQAFHSLFYLQFWGGPCNPRTLLAP